MGGWVGGESVSGEKVEREERRRRVGRERARQGREQQQQGKWRDKPGKAAQRARHLAQSSCRRSSGRYGAEKDGSSRVEGAATSQGAPEDASQLLHCLRLVCPRCVAAVRSDWVAKGGADRGALEAATEACSSASHARACANHSPAPHPSLLWLLLFLAAQSCTRPGAEIDEG